MNFLIITRHGTTRTARPWCHFCLTPAHAKACGPMRAALFAADPPAPTPLPTDVDPGPEGPWVPGDEEY